MNRKQAENLRILIRHMETECARTLDMGMFFHECGTPACALGEATRVPELQAQGLRNGHDCLRCDEDSLFGDGTAIRLFGTASHNVWERSDVTPQEWAIEARKVLAERGYAMDDGFAAFKAKILAPLDTAIA